ncbi:unnamed protein product [Bursaphelenchus xylophilus]|uniref:(pine wood nematode) hypothetical protein n=1 Tax=Bursaphelenchus xylophilus TaxID=6326 RepID=A0A1I7SWG5_BURXY|nr:unnamed protein product [Bursaphelenchus xylophilus]CAG9099383.1 unnamed protein product [Bursaphelenchus xylophilus]
MSTEGTSGNDGLDVKGLCDEITNKTAEAMRCALALPKLGVDYELYNVDDKFMKLNKNFQSKIFSMLSCTLSSNGYLLSGHTRLNDMSELVNANDHFLQSASMALERHESEANGDDNVVIRCLDGQLRKPTDAIGRDNGGRYSHISGKNTKFDRNVIVVKPQKAFQDAINNSSSRFIMKLPVKHNSLDSHPDVKLEYDESIHPYSQEIASVIPGEDTFTQSEFELKSLEATPLVIIDTEDKLRSLVSTLKKEKEFAVDVEHHSYRSFLGLSCLLQISTHSTDYIIDPFPMWKQMNLLNDPFSDPRILKVFHGAESDIIWLQRDFGIYVVNMIDTYLVMKALKMPKKSYQHLVFSSFGILLDKKLQKSDWRQRPLDNEHLQYARCDTHFLLPAFKKLCIRLNESDDFDSLSSEIFNKSKGICLKVFEQPIFDEEGYRALAIKELNNRQLYVLRCLWEWRDRTAREEDESLDFVLPNHMMLHIAEVLPREIQGILACCSPVPVIVKRDIFVIHRFVTTARDMPLEEKEQYSMALSLQETVKNRNLFKNRYTREYARLDSRFDQREYKVDEERPDRGERISTMFQDTIRLSVAKSKDHPLLPFKKVKSNVTGKMMKKVEEIRKRFSDWNPPFERYMRVLEEKKRKREEQQEEVPSNQYSHHCPAAPRGQTTEVKVEDMEAEAVIAPTESYIRKKKHHKLQFEEPSKKIPKFT